MPYDVLYRREFRRQKDECCHTYNARRDINRWLRSLVAAAEQRETADSLSVVEILEQELEHFPPRRARGSAGVAE